MDARDVRRRKNGHAATGISPAKCQTMAVSIIIDERESFINGRKEKGR